MGAASFLIGAVAADHGSFCNHELEQPLLQMETTFLVTNGEIFY